jgi:hypothetical protein
MKRILIILLLQKAAEQFVQLIQIMDGQTNWNSDKAVKTRGYLSVFMESLVFRMFSHASPRESTVDSYPIFKSAGMTTAFSI